MATRGVCAYIVVVWLTGILMKGAEWCCDSAGTGYSTDVLVDDTTMAWRWVARDAGADENRVC